MRIALHFPAAAIEGIKQLGLRQRNPERLRWTDNHPASSYGAGVLLRGKSGEILDGRGFTAMAKHFGAWVEVDSARTKQRVENALVTAASGLDDAIRITGT